MAKSCDRAEFINQGEEKQYPLQPEEPISPYLPCHVLGAEQVAAALKAGSTGCGQDVGDKEIIKSLSLPA